MRRTKHTGKVQTTVWFSVETWEYLIDEQAKRSRKAGHKLSLSEVADEIISEQKVNSEKAIEQVSS